MAKRQGFNLPNKEFWEFLKPFFQKGFKPSETRKEFFKMSIAEESLKKHYEWQGKIEVVTRCPIESREDLSLAYTPGVAQPCLEIQKDINK